MAQMRTVLLLLARTTSFILEVPDLTHPENVALFRTWDQREVAFVQTLRFIRISSTKTDLANLSRPGKHPSLVTQQDAPMDVEAEIR
jgi:translation machinery-associated protein 16